MTYNSGGRRSVLWDMLRDKPVLPPLNTNRVLWILVYKSPLFICGILRAVFNVIGRNQDDHTKNTGFLMDRAGKWSLSPAFDLTYSYDPAGKFTRNHQCWLNRKNNDFLHEDLLQFGRHCNLSDKKSREIIGQVGEAFSRFSQLAAEYELSRNLRETVKTNLRLGLLSKRV